MSTFDSSNFKIGPCAVAYQGKLLGATRDGILIAIEGRTVDISCDQSYGQPVKRVVTGQKITITMTMLEVDTNLALLLDDGRITSLTLGADLMSLGGELLLTPVSSTDNVGYRFPNALLERDSDYHLLSTAAHTVTLKFSALADSSGVLVAKVDL